jgi:hypothetical protein
LVLNDAGRSAVSGRLGNAVDKVEGVLTAQNADSYTLAVSEVYQFGGISSKWNGEPVTIAKDGTVGYQIHRFNQTRTVVLVVAITAAVVVFMVTTKLVGSGSDQTSTSGCPTCQTQRIHP